METILKPRQLSLILILILLSLIAVENIRAHAKIEQVTICTQLESNLRGIIFSPAKLAGLHAKAFILHDFSSNSDLSAKNADTPLPLASLTKLMTLRIALKNESPEAFYTVRLADLGSEDYVTFTPGESYRIRDLIRAALISSSNNAATMLARSTGTSLESFIASMNAEANNLGLSTLRYESVTGLDANNDTVPTAVGSARDLLDLLQRDYADFPELMSMSTALTDTLSASNGHTVPLSNTDTAIKNLALLAASKTGYTDTAGGNLAILWHEPNGHLMGAVVLGSTQTGRFDDMTALYKDANLFTAIKNSSPDICKTLL